MGGPPGNRRVLVSVPERYVAGGACPEPVEGTPEDARKDGHIRGRSKDGHIRGRSKLFMKYSAWGRAIFDANIADFS